MSTAKQPPTVFASLLVSRFVPEAVRELLSKSHREEVMVFDLEALPVVATLTREEIAMRRNNGPYADLPE